MPKVVLIVGVVLLFLHWMRRRIQLVRFLWLLFYRLTFPSVFQQIHVDEATSRSDGRIELRIFGVTEVWSYTRGNALS